MFDELLSQRGTKTIFLVVLAIFLISAGILDIPGLRHQMGRAALGAISTLGTSPMGIVVAILTILVGVLPIITGESMNSLVHRALEGSVRGLAVLGLFFLVLFIWNLFTMPPETFSPSEVAQFAQRSLVAIVPKEGVGSTKPRVVGQPQPIIGLGVWTDLSRNLVASCVDKANAPNVGHTIVGVARIQTPPPGNALLTEGMFVAVRGLVVAYDADIGIEIIEIPLPFSSQLVESNYGSTNGRVGAATSPAFRREPISVGESIFVEVSEPDSVNQPEPATKHDTISRIGSDLTARGNKPIRLYTSIDYESKYLGAPVFDASEQLVGIICGEDSNGHAVVIPSEYLTNLVAGVN